MSMKLVNGKVSQESSLAQQSGIGIANVRKRLELLYTGKHELRISNEAEVFVVDLNIELEKKVSRQSRTFELAEA
jgi:sensor histidine kinase YesM